MAKRNPPNKPLSPYDPKSRQMANFRGFGMGGGKIDPNSRHEPKGKICWCGNPDCPGGLQGGEGADDDPRFQAVPTGDGSFDASREAFERYARDMSNANNYDEAQRIREQFERQMDIAKAVEWQRRAMDEYVSTIRPGDVIQLNPVYQAAFNPNFVGNRETKPSTPKPPQPPASYNAALEKVKEHLCEVNHTTAWDDVVGNDDARQALMEAIEEPVKHPELYKHYGMQPPKGVMLYGPPGCGKTMFAKAAAAAVGRIYKTQAQVLVVNGPSIQSPYVGVTERTIREIFAFAREYEKFHNHPLTVFFDEADALFPDRTGRTRGVLPWEESQVAQFLAEIDGLNACGAFVILATNRPEALDEALLRDGRCDRKIEVKRPTRDAVEAILRKTLGGVPQKDQIEALVAAGTESFFNPHYVIREGHLLAQEMSTGKVVKDIAINFCLEHIVSGAMVVSVGRRAKSRAFARDRDEGTTTGISVPDVIDAVREIFEENKGLEHSFAAQEFVAGLPVQEMLEPKGRMQ